MQLELLDKRKERKEWWDRLVRQMDLHADQRIDLCDPGFYFQLAVASGLFDSLVNGKGSRLLTICITVAACFPEETGLVWAVPSVLSGAILALQIAARCEQLLDRVPARIRLSLACQLALEKSLDNMAAWAKYAEPYDSKCQNKWIKIATEPLFRLVCRADSRQKAA